MGANSSHNITGPAKHTTGLGLPLSRALAMCGNGWLGLEEEPEESWEGSPSDAHHHPSPSSSQPLSGSRRVASRTGSMFQMLRLGSTTSMRGGYRQDERYQTRYWCVIHTEVVKPPPEDDDADAVITVLTYVCRERCCGAAMAGVDAATAVPARCSCFREGGWSGCCLGCAFVWPYHFRGQ